MSDNEKPDICPTCGSYCRIAGNVTKHYVPFYSDAIKLELDKQNAEIKAQHEEIERLRAANKDALAWFEDLKVELDRVRRELDLANKFIDQAFEAHPNLPLDIEFFEKSGEPK